MESLTEWILRQNPEFLEDTLTEETLEELRNGKQIDKFKDEKYRPMSLSELKNIENLQTVTLEDVN